MRESLVDIEAPESVQVRILPVLVNSIDENYTSDQN